MESIALRPGLVIEARYRLDRWLGGGGMGVVWAATHIQMRHAVALKFLRPELALDPPTRSRFLREARASAAVRHPNVVTVHDFLECDGCPVIVMELLEGETLAARLAARGALGIEETAAILLPVVSAIGTAHARGIIHRDLKPDNVFLCAGSGEISRRVRVLDFGIAKLLEREPGSTSTEAGSLVGSPSYMSPEQVFCEQDIDHRSDAWSLGIVLYECLTGILPTKAQSLGQTLKLITSGTIPSVASHRGDLPREISDLVAALLDRGRKGRPDLALVRKRLRPFAPEADSPEFGPPVLPKVLDDADAVPADRTHPAEPLPPAATQNPGTLRCADAEPSAPERTSSHCESKDPAPASQPASSTTAGFCAPPSSQRRGKRGRWAWIGGSVGVVLAVLMALGVRARRGSGAATASELRANDPKPFSSRLEASVSEGSNSVVPPVASSHQGESLAPARADSAPLPTGSAGGAPAATVSGRHLDGDSAATMKKRPGAGKGPVPEPGEPPARPSHPPLQTVDPFSERK